LRVRIKRIVIEGVHFSHCGGFVDGYRATVVDNSPDWQELRQFGHAAHMVAMKVRDQQNVNSRDSPIACSCSNPLWITRLIGPSGLRLEFSFPRKPSVDQ